MIIHVNIGGKTKMSIFHKSSSIIDLIKLEQLDSAKGHRKVSSELIPKSTRTHFWSTGT